MVLLRILSIPLFLVSMYFIFSTYKKSIRPVVFLVLLLTLAISYYWLTYASLTYSEALFNLLQFGTIWFFYSRFIQKEPKTGDLIILVLSGLLLVKTKTIGASLIVALIIYFLRYRQWKNLLWFSAGSVLALFLWDAVTYFVLHDNSSVILSQSAGLLRKNPYDASQGSAGIPLVLERLFHNYNLYVSRHLLQALGLRSYSAVEGNWLYTSVFTLLIVLALFMNKTRERIISFSWIYLAVAMAVVFITPRMWSQARFIQPFLPIVFLVLVYEVRQLSGSWKKLPVLFVVLLFLLQLIPAGHYLGENIRALQAYHKGDRFYGHTPDWKNYFSACEWIGTHLSEKDGRIACRKPQIAALLAKEDNFYGIYEVPAYSCAGLTGKLLDNGQHFVAMDMEKFFRYRVPEQITRAMVDAYAGVIMKNSELSGLQLFSFSNTEIYSKIVEANKQLNFIYPLQSLLEVKNGFSVSFADSLLQDLRRNNVNYILLANLRVYKEKRTEEVLSSVHNYMTTIRIKYPEIFEQIYQTGLETQEPATVYRLNYSRIDENETAGIEDQSGVASGTLSEMMDWAIRNSAEDEFIVCRAEGDSYPGTEKGRLLEYREVPLMDLNDFLNRFRPGRTKYLIIDPEHLDLNRIDRELAEELNNSFHGLVYINRKVYRLHEASSQVVYRKMSEDSYLRGNSITYEHLLRLPEEQKASFSVIEPAYMLQVLKNKNVRYIIEDNPDQDTGTNIPGKLVYLISRKYPDAFYRVREAGTAESGRVTVYGINYGILR